MVCTGTLHKNSVTAYQRAASRNSYLAAACFGSTLRPLDHDLEQTVNVSYRSIASECDVESGSSIGDSVTSRRVKKPRLVFGKTWRCVLGIILCSPCFRRATASAVSAAWGQISCKVVHSWSHSFQVYRVTVFRTDGVQVVALAHPPSPVLHRHILDRFSFLRVKLRFFVTTRPNS